MPTLRFNINLAFLSRIVLPHFVIDLYGSIWGVLVQNFRPIRLLKFSSVALTQDSETDGHRKVCDQETGTQRLT